MGSGWGAPCSGRKESFSKSGEAGTAGLGDLRIEGVDVEGVGGGEDELGERGCAVESERGAAAAASADMGAAHVVLFHGSRTPLKKAFALNGDDATAGARVDEHGAGGSKIQGTPLLILACSPILRQIISPSASSPPLVRVGVGVSAHVFVDEHFTGPPEGFRM